MEADKLIKVISVIVEKKLKNFKVHLKDELRTIVRQEIRDALESSGSQRVLNDNPTPPNNNSADNSGGGEYDLNEMKRKLQEAQNLARGVDDNPNVYYDENGAPQDMSNVKTESVDKVKQNIKRDYSHLIN